MISLQEAISLAREKYKAKICLLEENDKAFIVFFSEDDGTIPPGLYPWRVDKEDGSLQLFMPDHPEFFKPVKRLPFPDGYGDLFVEPKYPEE